MADDPPPRPKQFWLYQRLIHIPTKSSCEVLSDHNETDDAMVSDRSTPAIQAHDVEFLVDDADYLGPVLAEDGYRFRVIRHGNRNAIERVFWENRTSNIIVCE